jgi:hypothetical protein
VSVAYHSRSISCKVHFRIKSSGMEYAGLVQIFGFGGYSFDIEKSGILNVRKEDGTLISIPLVGSFSGKFGFQAKATYGYLSEFTLYN